MGSPWAAMQRAFKPGCEMGSMKGWPRASTSHRLPSRTPITAIGPTHIMDSAGSAAASSPIDVSCEMTPPVLEAILTTCTEASPFKYLQQW